MRERRLTVQYSMVEHEVIVLLTLIDLHTAPLSRESNPPLMATGAHLSLKMKRDDIRIPPQRSSQILEMRRKEADRLVLDDRLGDGMSDPDSFCGGGSSA